MNDKEFDEIMNKYVESTKNDQRYDLQKLQAQPSVKSKSWNKKLVFSSLAIILVVGLALAIALPLSINNQQSEENTVYYCDGKDIEYSPMDASEITNDYLETFQPLKINCNMGATHQLMVYIPTNQPIGVMSNYAVYDEYFDEIKVYNIKQNYIINELENIISTCKDSAQWNGIEIKYNIVPQSMAQYSVYQCLFAINDMVYIISADVYYDFEVADFLNFLL